MAQVVSRRPHFRGPDSMPVQLRFVVHKVALERVNPEDGAEALKHVGVLMKHFNIYEGWNFNSGNYLFTTDTK